MGDIIKKIKIKKEDGTFTDYIPIGAEAENVITKDGESVEEKLDKKPYYFNTVIDMKNAEFLKQGDMAITLGYYEINDGGGAEYKINKIQNGGSESLYNNLYASIVSFSDIKYLDFYIKYAKEIIVNGISYLDWLPAFNKAISEQQCIYLKPHEYYISDSIIINKTLSILGDNKWKSKIHLIPTMQISGQGIITNRSEHCVFKNFQITGNDNLATDEKCGLYFNKIEGISNNDNLIDNIVISHIKGNGIYVEQNSFDNHIINTLIYAVDNGILLNTTDNFLSNCIVRGCQRDGIVLFRGSNTISDCKVYLTGKINNIEITENIGSGFVITDLEGANAGNTNKINNCFAQECGYHGFYAHDINNVQITNCYSDSNGVYINNSSAFYIDNCNYTYLTGCATNKAFLRGKNKTAIHITGMFNNVNLIVGVWTLYTNVLFEELVDFNQDVTNSIIINNIQYITPTYENAMTQPSETNINCVTDFTVANVGDPTGFYKIDQKLHCQVIEITNGKENHANKKIVLQKPVYANCNKISIAFLRKEDVINTNTLAYGRIIFYNNEDNELKRETYRLASEFINSSYASKYWTTWHYIFDIPEDTTYFKLELLLESTKAGAVGRCYFKDLKFLLFNE